ncbi:MAG TPA: M20/M25/M40 family metallo-hydrolase [Gemmatimonadales bacterium]
MGTPGSRRAAGVIAALLPLLVGVGTLAAQRPTDAAGLGDEAVKRAVEYLRINTTNPPGNEDQTMRFFARILADEGIPFDTASSAPGRGNIWARLKGGREPALVLLHHMDVVPADPRYWTEDPFAATEKDGMVYARGALDTKTLGIMELEAFLALHRLKTPLTRDVIFMATADEEAGGTFGAGWVVSHHAEAFAGAGLLLNEGGDGTEADGRKEFGVEITQKVPLWLELVSTGRPGHGSVPPVSSSVDRLVRALERLRTHEFAPRIVPAVDAYFKALAATAEPEWKGAYTDMAKATADPNALLRLQLEHPGLAALTRNTCSITILRGSDKINVIPPEARAQLDCRLLPDQDPAAFIREVEAVLDDPGIKVQKILGFTPAVSGTDTPLYRAIVDVTRRHFPDASIVPAVSTGFTDSHFFRDRGIASYGFAPILIPEQDEAGVHGNNERLSLDNIRRGTAMVLEIVQAVAGKAVR